MQNSIRRLTHQFFHAYIICQNIRIFVRILSECQVIFGSFSISIMRMIIKFAAYIYHHDITMIWRALDCATKCAVMKCKCQIEQSNVMYVCQTCILWQTRILKRKTTGNNALCDYLFNQLTWTCWLTLMCVLTTSACHCPFLIVQILNSVFIFLVKVILHDWCSDQACNYIWLRVCCDICNIVTHTQVEPLICNWSPCFTGGYWLISIRSVINVKAKVDL